MHSLRILFLAEGFHPIMGGVEEYNRGLAIALAEAGVELTIVAPSLTGDEAYDQELPFEIVRIGKKDVRQHSLGLLARYKAVSSTTKELKQWLDKNDRFDFAIVSPLSRWAIELEAREIKYCLCLHGADAFGKRSDFLRTLYRKKVIRERLENAQLICANSEYTAGLLPQIATIRNKTIVTYCGVPTSLYDAATQGIALRIPSAGISRFVTMSRLVPFKATDTVISAFAEVQKKFPNATLTVAGEGPEKDKLKALAESLAVEHSVDFIGGVYGESAKVKMLLAHDIFVQSGRYDPDTGREENFGIVFAEAAACGLPTIGARIGGIPEAISDQNTGLLVNPDDVSSTASAMCELLSRPEKALKMGLAGRLRVSEIFNYHIIAKRITEKMAINSTEKCRID